MDCRANSTLPRRVLLLDLDNCPGQLASVVEDLTIFDRIVACHGVVEPKISLTLAKRLAHPIETGRVEFLGMSRSGRNAADFGLAFVAGRLLVEEPPNTEFVIVSHDGDLDHVVDLLLRNQRKASRLSKTAVPERPAAPAIVSGAEKNGSGRPAVRRSTADAADEFINEHLKRLDQRPKKKQGLRNLINMYFQKNSGVDREGVLEELVAREVVRFQENGALTYHFVSLEVSTAEVEYAEPPGDDDEIPF